MRLKASVRSRINGDLADLCRSRHRYVPLGDAQRILDKHGLCFEDVMLCGREGRANLDLSGDGETVDNAMLVITWYKGDFDGCYESTMYVS